MAWVVKTWRTEPLATAEREARHVRRVATREVADADAHLGVLEDLGRELLEGVRQHRRPAERPDRTFRRTTLRESPLAGLFQATEH